MRTRCAVFLVTSAAVVLAGCGSDAATATAEPPLSERDPDGHAACSIFMNPPREWAEGASDIEVALGGNMIAHDHAIESTTPAIRASVDEDFDVPGHGMVEADELIAACEDNGLTIQAGSLAEERAQRSS